MGIKSRHTGPWPLYRCLGSRRGQRARANRSVPPAGRPSRRSESPSGETIGSAVATALPQSIKVSYNPRSDTYIPKARATRGSQQRASKASIFQEAGPLQQSPPGAIALDHTLRVVLRSRLLGHYFPRVKLDEHGRVRIEVLHRHEQPEVVEEEELHLEVVELGEREATDLSPSAPAPRAGHKGTEHTLAYLEFV